MSLCRKEQYILPQCILYKLLQILTFYCVLPCGNVILTSFCDNTIIQNFNLVNAKFVKVHNKSEICCVILVIMIIYKFVKSHQNSKRRINDQMKQNYFLHYYSSFLLHKMQTYSIKQQHLHKIKKIIKLETKNFKYIHSYSLCNISYFNTQTQNKTIGLLHPCGCNGIQSAEFCFKF